MAVAIAPPRGLIQLGRMYFPIAWSRSYAWPMNAWATAAKTFWSHPLASLHLPLGRHLAAGAELLERSTRHYAKPPFALETTRIEGSEVPVREEVTLRTPFCDLLHFRRETSLQHPKLLVVAPLSGHHASLLRDTVAALLPDHDVYVTDWVDARLVPLARGSFDLDDYIELVQRFLRAIGPGAHVLAVCQPAVPVLAAVSLMAEDGDAAAPRTMTLMSGPVDPRVNPTAPNRLATTRPLSWFESSLIQRVPAGEPGGMRLVYPGLLQLAAFVSMNYERHLDAHWQLYHALVDGADERADAHRRFYDDYFAVMDLPAEYYLQTIATVFQRHDLPLGRMLHRRRAVRPEAIRDTALLTVEGGKDDITGVGQTRAAHALCSSIPDDRREHHLQPDVGHYGTFSGRRWREEIAPRLRAFIRAHM